MMKSIALVLAMVGGLAAFPVGATDIPNNVVAAEKSIQSWVDVLVGKSQAEVIKQLGTPAERSTWDYKGPEPLLKFNMSGGATLNVYFAGDRSVKVSYHLMSR